MRRHLTFPCMGETLAATLDEAAGDTGLLIVSGGNELRIGAHRGMALAAAAIAAQGFPVFRFDRRGIGESGGINLGFRSSGPDIAAAAAAFRTQAGVGRIVAFGNCDAATALALFHEDAGIDALLLANPWIIEPIDELPPAAAIRARYGERLRSPAEWLRLVRGGVDLRGVIGGVRKIIAAKHERSPLMAAFVAGLEQGTPTRILLAEGDNTAIAFASEWRGERLSRQVPVVSRPTASHSFGREGDAAWLREQMLAALR
ncbi:hydrolase 1, exosortase A system-associated [Sphingomonas sp. Leaf4]|uniref:hydrolase 1, exosortase A system-associated n=1 Tax=Sphingomonas sp. Leaf4 TaxID=2876553 RepID=UPI001E519DA8|nr:hydrolase 1, exosortase A system-associated [Sphingomonas sp. Leaf4]